MTSNKAGVYEIEPRDDLLYQHSVSTTNCVVDLIFVINFGDKQHRLLKGMIIARLKAVGYPIPASSMATGEALGIEEYHVSNEGMFADQAFGAVDRKSADFRLAPKEPKNYREIYSVDYIDDDVREKFREMLRRHEDIWDGCLGVIEAIYHRIETSADTHPLRRRPYRAGPKASQIRTEEIARQLRDGIIRPSQSE